MPYYSIRLTGGNRENHIELKTTFSGRDADYTGATRFFYVQRDYDIEMMRMNAESAGAGSGITVDVNEISEDQFNWKKLRAKK